VEQLSLSQFVRRTGGIRPDPDRVNAGELRLLSNKEARTSGLLNRRSKFTASRMMEHAGEVGFRDSDGRKFDDPNQFLQAVLDDQLGYYKVYHPGREYDVARRNAMKKKSAIKKKTPSGKRPNAKRRSTLLRKATKRSTLLRKATKRNARKAKPQLHTSKAKVARKKSGRLGANRNPIEETKGELRYRLADPEKFTATSFRRITLKKTAPRIHAIVGRLKGRSTTTLQALRFPKSDRWTAARAARWLTEYRKGNPLLATLGHLGGTIAGISSSFYVWDRFQKKRKEKEKPSLEQPKSNRAVRTKPNRPKNVSRLFSEFQGRPNSGEVRRYYVPPGSPADLAQLGKLHKIVLSDGRELTFRNNPAVLAAGGGAVKQRLYIGLSKPYANPKGAKVGEAYDYGTIKRVEYKTAKPHLYGTDREFPFYHNFGDETLVRPRLILGNGRLKIRGGDASVTREGVRN
jgi:hypothetical protein